MISVIIPVYNADKYLKKCVKAVISQTYTDFELLLIDDGSTDNSGIICDELSACDSRIKTFHKENGGVSSARNAGIEYAAGEYIAFVDADDIADINYLSKMYESLIKNDADISVWGLEFIKNDITDMTTASSDVHCVIPAREVLSKQPSDNLMLWGPYCKLYKTGIIKENNIRFDEALYNGEDIVFIAEYLLYCKNVYYDTDTVYRYMSNSESASGGMPDKKKLTFFSSLEKLISLSCDNGLHEAALKWKLVYYDYAANNITALIRSGIKGGEIYQELRKRLSVYYKTYKLNVGLRKRLRADLLNVAPILSTEMYWLLKGKSDE